MYYQKNVKPVPDERNPLTESTGSVLVVFSPSYVFRATCTRCTINAFIILNTFIVILTDILSCV